MNLLAARLVGLNVGEKCLELGRGVSRGGLAHQFAAVGMEGGVQRQRAVLEASQRRGPGSTAVPKSF